MPPPILASRDFWYIVSDGRETTYALLIISTAIYIAHILVAFKTIDETWCNKARPHRIKHGIFILLLLILGTFNLVGYAVACQNVFLETPHAVALKSGDPSAVMPLLGCISTILITTMTEGYLMYRCSVVWSHRFIVLAVPAVLYVFSLVTGSIFLYTSSHPPSRLLSSTTSNALANITYISQWASAVSTNLLLTTLIIFRLLYLRSKSRVAFGSAHGRIYTGVIALLVESSLLYTLVAGLSVPFRLLTLAGTSSAPFDSSNMMSPLVAQTECIAAELIVWRFAIGRAWSSDTAHVISERSERRQGTPVLQVHITSEVYVLDILDICPGNTSLSSLLVPRTTSLKSSVGREESNEEYGRDRKEQMIV